MYPKIALKKKMLIYYFCRYSLEVLGTAEILKNHVAKCFLINGKQNVKTPKKV